MNMIIALFLLALCIISTPLTEKYFGQKAGYLYAAVFAAALSLIWSDASKVIDINDGPSFSYKWIESLDINFTLKLNGLGLLFSSLILGIGALVLFYSAQYLPKYRNASFYALICTFAFAMLGLVLIDDIVVLFIFWEFTTLCSFFLISRSGQAGYLPSLRTLLLTGAGGLSLLSAVTAIRVEIGTSSITQILASPIWHERPGFTATMAVLIIIAAFTKSAQFPFHAWLPDAMAAIMPVSAYLHAAAMVKAGIFLLLRFSPIFYDTPTWNIILISTGLITMIMGAIFALQRDDLKELLAYSTVSQLGFLVATIGIGTKLAIAAAILHVLAHALFKSSLFMSAGVLDKLTGTRKLSELSGIGKQVPFVGITITLSCLSMAGVFPLLGFISKEYILKSLNNSPGPSWTAPTITIFVIFGSILTFAYCGKIVLAMFRGNKTERRKGYSTLNVAPAFAALLGIVSALTISWINPLIKSATSVSTSKEFDKYFHLIPDLSKELGFTLVIVIIGSLLAFYQIQLNKAIDRPLFPGNGVKAFEAIRRTVLNAGVRVRNITSVDSPPRHLAVPLAMLATLFATVLISKPELAPQIGSPDRATDWFLLAFLTIPIIGITIAKSRIAALVLLGAIGISLTLLYFTLGAPDVGFTQLLIELLTVIFMMFALRRLPKKFHRTHQVRKSVSAFVAIGFGLIAGLATYAYTGRRQISEVGKYYLENAKLETGGTNVVNTILVDFRAIDTLVELTVFATAGLAIMAALLSAKVLGVQRRPHIKHKPTAADYFKDNNIPVRLVSKTMIPLSIIMSIYLMLRGHYEPGGGFIAALVTSVGIALLYLGTDHRNFINAKWLPYLFIGGGMAIAVLTSLLGYLNNSFLKPLHLDISTSAINLNLSTAIVFDTGVYLAVIGVVLAAINRISSDSPTPSLKIPKHVNEIEDLSGPISPSEVPL